MFVYFGFTACPDVCPTELTKMTKALKLLPKEVLEYVQPIFITCDPARDSCEAIEKYLKDYHPKFIGLTGTPEQIRHCSKKYRVYYSGPIKEYSISDEDYQVDHSIFEYFMDPNGRLVEFFSRTSTEEEIVSRLTLEINKYKKEIKN
jgi:protein SCO1